MKNFLKKLQKGSNQSEYSEGSSASSRSNRVKDGSPPTAKLPRSKTDHKPFSTISGWLNSVSNKRSPSPPSSSYVAIGDRMEPSDSVGSSSLDAALDAVRLDSGSGNSKENAIEEEYQIQLALELSAKEDPEAVQIEAVKQISLGSCPPENTPAEVAAYRYWNYNALSYDDKVLDGFYDLYGIMADSTSSRMPSLGDLQATPVSCDISWEAILVNREADTELLKLEQKALEMCSGLRSLSTSSVTHIMVHKLATLVSDHMGGPVVGDPDRMLAAWRNLSCTLKEKYGSMVLPIGSLTIGLARHRALLFKVLADFLGIPCRLVRGPQFTGSDDVAMNLVKIGGREYIVDLMADPGTLIPSDAAGANQDYEDSLLPAHPASENAPSHGASSSGRTASSFETSSDFVMFEQRFKFRNSITEGNESTDEVENISSSALALPMKGHGISEQYAYGSEKTWGVNKGPALETASRPSHTHARSPSWTEGVSSPAVRKKKVKDVSKYMIEAAKENPQLAQKLHDVLLESGVNAPPDLFTEVYADQLAMPLSEVKLTIQENEDKGLDDKLKGKGFHNFERSFLPPLPPQGFHLRGNVDKHPQFALDIKDLSKHDVSSDSETTSVKSTKSVPVAAAAAAAAAVVASSMVAAVAKASSDSNLQLPVSAAATATAAAVVATTAAVTKQFEVMESFVHSPDHSDILNPTVGIRSDGDTDVAVNEHGSGDRGHGGSGASSGGEKISDRSTENESSKSDSTMDDVADCEIPWEDISLGERIGLGSYGEVYRGDWHGTEVAVKKFLDQDLAGESLEEFRSEVRIMRKVRHPNVVLFMGAVTRPPNLSIITEFLPRGSLYRLLHRPNNQLDERRRLKMALDAARGMNYLHNCTPVIVHRDLKSPNLLVDKNWVVKVGDFGLSRMKHSTYLSSRSTAGTAEWMAPEVLRNEPSNEKCDVYSFGVILWELCTMQQPWGGMNPMQVVGAVGFQHRRLDMPDDMDPVIRNIILRCWETDPNLRPSFTEIMAALKPLQRPITASQTPKSVMRRG